MNTKVKFYILLIAISLLGTNQGFKRKDSTSESITLNNKMFQNSDKVLAGVQTDATPMNFFDRNNRAEIVLKN